MGPWRDVANRSKYLCWSLIVTREDNANPEVPEIEGLIIFGGKLMHSNDHKNEAEFRGRKVLVVACGNSGIEISQNLSHNGARVSLVVRQSKALTSFTLFTEDAFTTWRVVSVKVSIITKRVKTRPYSIQESCQPIGGLGRNRLSTRPVSSLGKVSLVRTFRDCM
ncbi:hypothetical protein R6Q59_008136 [Mikania micrantha]